MTHGLCLPEDTGRLFIQNALIFSQDRLTSRAIRDTITMSKDNKGCPYNHSPHYRFPSEIGTAHVCSGLKVANA